MNHRRGYGIGCPFHTGRLEQALGVALFHGVDKDRKGHPGVFEDMTGKADSDRPVIGRSCRSLSIVFRGSGEFAREGRRQERVKLSPMDVIRNTVPMIRFWMDMHEGDGEQPDH